MNEDFSLTNWAFTTLIGVGGASISWLMNRSINRMDRDIESHGNDIKEHSKMHAHCTLELSQFKTEVAKDYAKEASVQNAVARVHDRIDALASNVDRKMDVIIGLLKK